MATENDILIEGLPLEEVEAAFANAVQYLQVVCQNEECESCAERYPNEVFLHVAMLGRRTKVLVTISSNENKTVEKMTGFMQSPLLEPNANPVHLHSFADLLDFLMVHLCPIVCIPRALFYVVHALQLLFPAEVVERHMDISDEGDGEFVLTNAQAGKECHIKIRSSTTDGKQQMELSYSTKKHSKTIKEPQYCGMPDEGYDFVQHAFDRRKDITYMQHPDIADALTKLLRQIELGTTADADLRNQAHELIRGSKIRSRDRQSGQLLSLRDQGG
jgi:hypothetical protein